MATAEATPRPVKASTSFLTMLVLPCPGEHPSTPASFCPTRRAYQRLPCRAHPAQAAASMVPLALLPAVHDEGPTRLGLRTQGRTGGDGRIVLP